MKPIIIDMKDMSDSTEVYESRPNPVLAGFIYLLLAIVVVAIVWMYFFKMDIVVKGTGTVATAGEVATVTNQVAGTIVERKVQDGQVIKKGDVLYTISVENQELQLDMLESQRNDNEARTAMLQAYQAWLEDGTELDTLLMNNLYYSEIVSRKSLVELGKESTLQTYNDELSAYDAKLNANAGMITYYQDAIAKSKQMIEDIKNKENSFPATDTYHWNTVENFLVQYQNTSLQYEDTINKFRKDLNAAKDKIDELEQSKAQLQNRPVTVQDMTVSGGDAIAEQALLEQQLQEIEVAISAQKEAKESAEKSISDYSIQKSSALNAYEKESIVAIENSIFNYQQNINSYEGANLEYKNGKNSLKSQGTELEVNNLMTQEKYSVAEELESCRQNKLQLEQQIQNLEQGVKDAMVKATMDGTVNLSTELVEGDYMAAGQQVLTIIPGVQGSEFIVRSYVENKDIAKIHEGMEVTYEIAAYPTREYGTMRGVVTFVSADLKVNNNGSAYYLVETTVDATDLRNEMGEAATLKVGMLCETKIVVEEKSVLEILVEKIFHLGK